MDSSRGNFGSFGKTLNYSFRFESSILKDLDDFRNDGPVFVVTTLAALRNLIISLNVITSPLSPVRLNHNDTADELQETRR